MQNYVGISHYQRVINITLKSLIFLVLCLVLYRQLSGKWSELHLQRLFSDANYLYLLSAVVLMPINWLLEAMKWRLFLSGPYQLSFWQALRAVCTGVTFSMFTPFRAGDYLGRILAVEPQRNGPVVVATLAGNLCQLLILLCCGWFGLLYFAPQALTLPPQDYKFFLISGALGTITLFFVIIYMRDLLSFAFRQKRMQPYKDKLQPWLNMLDQYDWQTFLRASGLAFLRYFTYLSQFVLLLYFGQVNVPIPIAYAGVASIFLVQTSVPLPPALGLLARGEVALLFWAPFTSDPLPVLAASFGLFIINLVLPALIGLGVVLKINVLQSLGYEKTKD